MEPQPPTPPTKKGSGTAKVVGGVVGVVVGCGCLTILVLFGMLVVTATFRGCGRTRNVAPVTVETPAPTPTPTVATAPTSAPAAPETKAGSGKGDCAPKPGQTDRCVGLSGELLRDCRELPVCPALR